MSMSLRSSQEVDPTFASLLPYFDIKGAYLLLTDGGVATGGRIQGIDVHCEDDRGRMRICDQLSQMAEELEEGCEVQWIFGSDNRYEADQQLFSSYVNQVKRGASFAQDLARSKCQHFSTLPLFQSHLSAFVVIPRVTNASWPQTWVKGPKDPFAHWDARAQKADKAWSVVQSGCRALGANIETLSDASLYKYLYRELHPNRSKAIPPTDWRTVRLPIGAEHTLRSYLPSHAVTELRDALYFNGTYARMFTLKNYPQQTFDGMMLWLLQGLSSGDPATYRVHVRLNVPSQEKELSAQQRKRNFSNVFMQLGAQRNLEAEAAHEAAEGAMEQMIKNNQRLYHVSVALTLFEKRRKDLDQRTNDVLLHLRKLGGAEGMIEEYGQLPTYLSSLPGVLESPPRPFRIRSDQVGHMLPVYEPWKGTSKARTFFLNPHQGVVKWDLFDRKALENYNALVVGASGMGKSFTVSYLTQAYAAQGFHVWFVDVGGSYARQIECFGGENIRLDLTCALNPFFAPDEVCLGPDKFHEHRLTVLLGILERMLREGGKAGLSNIEQTVLDRGLRRLYKKASEAPPLLETFVAELQDMGKRRHDGSIASAARALAQRLLFWVEGPYAHVVNRSSTVRPNSPLVGFDLKGLEGDLRSVALLIINAMLEELVDAVPTEKILVLDECWDLLKYGASVVEARYRTGRKQNLSVISVTQSFSDFLDCPIAPAILSNSAVRYVLPIREGHDVLQKHLHLNDREGALLQQLRQEKGRFSELFVQFGGHHTVLRLSPSPLEYWTATTHPPDLAMERELMARHPSLSRQDILKKLAQQFPKGAEG